MFVDGGVELFGVLTARKLLITGTATTAKTTLLHQSIVRLTYENAYAVEESRSPTWDREKTPASSNNASHRPAISSQHPALRPRRTIAPTLVVGQLGGSRL